MLAKYVALCKSIRRLLVRCFRREFAKDMAPSLKCCKTSLLDFVASVCKSIALCIVLTDNILFSEYKHGGKCQFLPPLKRVGILGILR